MHNRSLPAALLSAVAFATPALADLTVDANLGTLTTSSVIPLTGTTVGQTNEAFVYSTSSNTGTTVWGNGEVVYQFVLTKPSFLYMTGITEPDANGFPDPDHDYFLLNSLTTTSSNNTAASTTNPVPFNFVGKPEGTSLAFVTNTVDSGTQAINAGVGIFRNVGANSPVNARGVYQPGTYYMAVDGRAGSVNTFGTANQLPAGNFSGTLNVKAVDEVIAPAASAAEASTGGQVSGSYTPNAVVWVSFDYTAGTAFSVNTQGNTLNNGGDTVLSLYDSEGTWIKSIDDNSTGLGLWSELTIAASEGLASGKYYIGLTQYKPIANPGFDLSVYVNPDPTFPPSTVAGTWVINGLTAVPEPTALALLAAIPAVALRRRRK